VDLVDRPLYLDRIEPFVDASRQDPHRFAAFGRTHQLTDIPPPGPYMSAAATASLDNAEHARQPPKARLAGPGHSREPRSACRHGPAP
jgi:hypothetical protein